MFLIHFAVVLSSLQLTFGTTSSSTFVPFATFGGPESTTYDWTTVNDPVMGGVSHSKFEVDEASKQGHWHGAVEIVPSLKAPGFCNLQSTPYGKTADFPDFTDASSFIVNAMQNNSTGINKFNIMINTKGAMHYSRQGVYTANLPDFTSVMRSHEVQLSDFQCTWRGQSVNWCPEIETQLNQITNIALGTYFPGEAGSFDVHIANIGVMMPQKSLENTNRRIKV